MGIKDFLMRKMLEQKLKDVPKDEQEKLFKLIQENPELFQKIALEVQEEMKKGKDQMAATMSVMQRHQKELQGLMSK